MNEIWNILKNFKIFRKEEKVLEIVKNMLQMSKGPFELKFNDSAKAKITIKQLLRCHWFPKMFMEISDSSID